MSGHEHALRFQNIKLAGGNLSIEHKPPHNTIYTRKTKGNQDDFDLDIPKGGNLSEEERITLHGDQRQLVEDAIRHS
jgi:hypothetical protein